MTSKRNNVPREEAIRKGLAINTGLCTMCGLCVAVCPTGNLALTQSRADPYIAFGETCNDCGMCRDICPAKDVPLKELDNFLFGRERDFKKELLGITRACYQANATDPEIRSKGTSGGVVTALLVYALEKKLISAANVVVMDKKQPWKAVPVLATTREEIICSSQSKYVIVPVNAGLVDPEIKKLSGTVGCVGLACHVHGLRKLQFGYPDHFLGKKVGFIIGVACATNRPMSVNEYVMKKQFGLKCLDEIKNLSYRKGKAAAAYGEIIKVDGEVLQANKYYKYKYPRHLAAGRCMLCWDWGAELADVSVSDFFGPAAPGSDVHSGASTLMVRTQSGEQLVNGAVEKGYIKVYPTPAEPVLRSSGLMGKKLGRATALMAFKKFGFPCPDYQYEIEPTDLPDKTSLACAVSVEERERFWEKMGIRPMVRENP